jgi:hypothetical protein
MDVRPNIVCLLGLTEGLMIEIESRGSVLRNKGNCKNLLCLLKRLLPCKRSFRRCRILCQT